MANTLKQFGAQSATFTVPAFDTDEGFIYGTLTVTDWAGLPKGKLKDLLNTPYLTTDEVPVPDTEAFYTAAAENALTEQLHYQTVTEDVVSAFSSTEGQWTLDEDGYPILQPVATGTTEYMARVSVSYSASE